MDDRSGSHTVDVPPPGPIKPTPKYISLKYRNFHRYSRGYRQADCCQRLICCSCTFLFFLSLLFLLAFVATFTILNPKLPKYKVSSITADSLNVNPANPNVSSAFTLFLEAENPNKRIGIWYRDSGTASASFRGITLCKGPINQFLQPGNNITLMKIYMAGESEEESGARAALLKGIAGPPPGEAFELCVVAKVPVAFLLDNQAALWRFRIDIVFTLMLNSITPGRPIRISSRQTNILRWIIWIGCSYNYNLVDL